MAMIRLPPDLKDFLRLLSLHSVEYLLIGGYAVAYHGYPRATGDMDIWIARAPENADKMVAVLKEFDFDVPKLAPDLFLQKQKVIRMGVPPIRIEIITDITGVEFSSCYRNKVVDWIDDVQVQIIDLAALKANKKSAGRKKDLNDLEHLP